MTSAYACARCQDRGTESLWLDLGSCPECHHLGTSCPGPSCKICAIQKAQYELLAQRKVAAERGQAQEFAGIGAPSARFH